MSATPGRYYMQARLDGQVARWRGQQIADNPYPMGYNLSHGWGRGWKEVDRQLERKQ